MNISGKDLQTLHECLVAVSRRPPWVKATLDHDRLYDLAHAWPRVDFTPETMSLIRAVLDLCSETPEAEEFVSIPRAELKGLWDRIEKGASTPGDDDPGSLFERSRRYAFLGDRHSAQIFRLRAHDAAAARKDTGILGKCLTTLAYDDLGTGNYEKALERIEEAIPLLRKVNDPAALGEGLLTYAYALEWNERSVKPELPREARKLLLKAGLKRQAAECMELLARLEPHLAAEHLKRAATLFDESESQLGAPRALIRLAEFEGSVERGEEALAKIREVQHNRLARAGEAACLEVLGDLHRSQGNESRAREEYTRSLELFESLEHGGAKKVRGKLKFDREDPPKLHPSIKSDQWMTVRVSWKRTAARSDEAVPCPRGPSPCGSCSGKNVRCVFYEDDSGTAWRKYFMEFYCRSCGCYTTWNYDD